MSRYGHRLLANGWIVGWSLWPPGISLAVWSPRRADWIVWSIGENRFE